MLLTVFVPPLLISSVGENWHNSKIESVQCSPQDEITKVLCNYKEEVVINFGKLILSERDLPLGHNLANYVD